MGSQRPHVPDSGTRNLLIVSLALVGIGEAGFLFVGLSIFGLLVVSAAELNGSQNPPYAPSNRLLRYLRGLASKAPNQHRARLFLHSIYYLLGPINFFAILFILLDLVATGIAKWNWLWGLFFGLSAFTTIQYERSALNLVGQQYRDTRGSSLIVAASCGHLAGRMLDRKVPEGFDPLLVALRMADSAFDYRGYRPTQLPAVLATVEALIELDDPPLDELAKLSKSIESLPRRDSLPTSFQEFLTNLKWPAGFETFKGERRPSLYDRLNLIAIITLAVVGVLAFVIPGSLQQEAYPALSSFLAQQAGNFIGLAVLIYGMFYSFRTLSYSVPPKIVRKYIPRVREKESDPSM